VRDIEWAETALQDMAALDRAIARRIKTGRGAFSSGTGAGIDPPKYRLASATIESVSTWTAKLFAFSASGIAVKPTVDKAATRKT
jgi:hypothetical protein